MPCDPNVRGRVYLIVNDQHLRQLKIGFTLEDPLDRARNLASTGTGGTFVVIYEATVNAPKNVEDDVHDRLSDHRREGEWFEIDADTAVATIRRCAGAIHDESAEARWPLDQAAPHPDVMEMVAESRRAAEVRREPKVSASEAIHIEERRPVVKDAGQRSTTRRVWSSGDLLLAIPIAVSLFAVVGMIVSQAIRTPFVSPPTTPSGGRPVATTIEPEVQSKRREVSRLDESVADARRRLAEAEGRLQRLQQTVETLPAQSQALKTVRADHERTIRDAERTLSANEAEYRDFSRTCPDLRDAARQQAEKAEKDFLDQLYGEFLAGEDAITAVTGRPMHPQGIDNNINRIRNEAEPDAIRVYNAAADKAMARLNQRHSKLANLVLESEQRLVAAREAKAADDARTPALQRQRKGSQQELIDARTLVTELKQRCRLAEAASEAAREDLQNTKNALRSRAFSQEQLAPVLGRFGDGHLGNPGLSSYTTD